MCCPTFSSSRCLVTLCHNISNIVITGCSGTFLVLCTGTYIHSKCSKNNVDSTTYQTANNTFYANITAGETGPKPCGAKDFKEWQSWGQDVGSGVVQMPSLDGLMEIVKRTIAL